MLLQDATPDTSAYMIAGYVIFTLIMAIYLVSLLLRRRNLEQDLTTLETIQAENKTLERKPLPGSRPISKAGRAKAGKGRATGRKLARKK